jgi:hypothetical protein
MTSSPFGSKFFARSVPRSFLNREPILDGPELLVDNNEGARGMGTASTLVDAETRRGVEIWLGEMRLRDEEPF